MRLYKTTAIVLQSVPYREADVLLTLYAPARGKIRALAKGVRRPKSRLRGGVQPLTQSSFVLYAGRTLDTVTQCQPEATFPRLHADLERWAYANYLAELLLACTGGSEESPALFALLLAALHLLEDEEPALVARFFAARLLVLLGYGPELSRCTACGRAVPGDVLTVGAEGLLCQECATAQTTGGRLSRRSLAALEYLMRARPATLGRVRLGEAVLEELETVLDFWLGRHLERPLKSVAFLHGLKR